MAHHIHRPKKKEMKWRIDKSADAASESCLLLSSEREGKKNQSQYQFAQNPKTGLKKINQMSKVSSSFVGHESIGGNDIRAEGDVSRPYHQSATSHNPANRNLSGGTFGHRSGSDHFHSQEDVNTDTAKTNHLFSAFAPEINLQRMGYSVSDTIDWDRVQLPPKSDLHKQIHFRITNCINPDVLIRIGSSEFRYHMLVLQCYSSFFDEKSVRQIELPESVVSKEAFACIYDWMLHLSQDSYHLLRRDNILSIFSAAQYLGIKELEEQCWAFIDNEDLFNEDTAFLLYLDARKCNNLAVMELMVPRIQRFFLTLVSSKDWLELTVEEVCVFLSSNYISVHCEMEVFMSGVRWLMHDWSNRASHLNDVMRCIRFGLIAPWQLVDIRRNPESPEFIEVTKIPEVQQLVEDGLAFAIIKYWYVQESGDYYHWLDSLKLTEPVPRNWVGSEKNFSSYREFLNDLDLYRRPNSTQKKPDNLPNEKEYSEDESSLSDAASTSVASEPVILRKPVSRKNAPVPSLAEFLASHKDGVSGHENLLNQRNNTSIEESHEFSEVKNSISKNNPLTSKGVMMTSQRNYLEEGSLFFENRESVLVFGGIDPHRPYGSERNTGKDVYRYHPEENVWEFVTELPEPRHHHSVAFMKGRIYVVGGADPRESDSSTRAKIVSTVWSFEPVTRAWYTETSMKIARKNFGLVSVNSKLYVIGGQDKYQRILSNVERFDPQTGKWDEMAPLESGRMGVAAAKYRDVIWVCGGMTCAKKSILTSRVDCYDTHRNVWTQGVPLRFPRCFSILFPMNDSLYLIGGAGRQTDRERATSSTSAIDVWDPKKKEWRQECGMAIPRHGHSACYLGLQILILGGVTTSGMCALDKVECWCCQRSAWIRGLANLPSALSGQGSVTLPPAALM